MIRADFALDYTQSGLLISAFTLSYGISQLPAGWLADRIGPNFLIMMSISGVALAGILVGLSQTYLMMIVFLVLMGMAGGGYHPASPPLISKMVEPRIRGRALGTHVIGGSSSHFLSPLMAVAIATGWGWRGSFIGLAIPAFVFGIIFHRVLSVRAKKEEKERKETYGHTEIPSSSSRLRPLAAFLMLSSFTQAMLLSIISFIPLFMVDNFGVSKEIAAASVAVIYSAGLWSGPVAGYISDRLGSRLVILVVCLISGPLVYLLNLLPYGIGFGILLLTIGMSIIMRSVVSQAYIVDQTSEHHRSTIFGIYFFFGNEGSGILTPAMGYLIDRLGFYYSFTIAGLALVVVTVSCSIFLLLGGRPKRVSLY
jgi:MFS family permease